jgi:hypothetical protein
MAPYAMAYAAPAPQEQLVDPSTLTAEAELLMAEIPDWVEIAAIPEQQSEATLGLAASQAVHSDQYMVTKDGGIAYQRMVYRISDRSALEDYGTMSIEWEPSRSKATLHRFNIIRDGEVIDIVEKQGDFSLFRREANLSEGILNGQITASMQIEDLRVGDMIEFAYSIETSYAPMTGHYQNWHYFSGATQADRLVQRISWPKDKYVNIIVGEKMPDMPVKTIGKYKVRGFAQDNVDWEAMPEGLMARYYRDKAFEISTFKDWGQLADAFRPAYENAMVIPESGPLRDYVESVRAQNLGQRDIAEKVLAMVQTDIRYVGNFQGLGNYTPAPAASVWESKFGDCKGKTILLVAILRELGVDATPSLVNSDGNDDLEGTIPMPGWFDHVFARIRIDGETFWLDGTRLSDNNFDLLPPVFYDYTLPLEPESDLAVLTDKRYKQPQSITKMVIDSSAGFDEPAKVKAIFSVFGDQGIVFANSLNGKSEQEISRQIDKLIQNSEDEDFIAESVDYDVDLPNKKASVTITGKAVTSWGDAEDFRETQLDQLNIGRNFYRERKEEDYEDYSATPLWTDASYTVAEVEVILPENSGQIEITGSDYEEKLGPAIYKRKVEQEGNIVRGSLSTNIARGTYLPVAAKIWDKKTDDMFDDKVYIAIFGDNAAAAKRFANYDSNIKEAGSLADNGQLQAAANILNPLIDSDPNNVKLLVARGRIGQDAGMQERDLLRALLIEPSNMDALRTIAEVYLEQDNISLGKAMLERIIKKDQDHVWAKEQMDDIRSKNKDG